MFLGNNNIVKKSKITAEVKDDLLRNEYFTQEYHDELALRVHPALIHIGESRYNFFKWNTPNKESEFAVLKLLDNEKYDYKKFDFIEYWFQDLKEKSELQPHCDHNYKIRHDASLQSLHNWIHTQPVERVTSPITLAIYLEVSHDMLGGKLVISDETWFDKADAMCLSETEKEMVLSSPNNNVITPQEDDILYFHGSTNFHWITPITAGTRKSMLINFWME